MVTLVAKLAIANGQELADGVIDINRPDLGSRTTTFVSERRPVADPSAIRRSIGRRIWQSWRHTKTTR